MAKQAAAVAKPFIEHVHELRQRLFYSIAAIMAGGCLGFAVSDRLIDILRQPLHQTLFYTTPTGAFSFVIKMSLSFGVVLALPIILYQIIQFLSPLMHAVTKRYIAMVMFFSIALAAVGIIGAYYISLPSALKFLTTFHSSDIKSLITANEYFNFVLAYLAGSALLFQLPLIMLVINKIKPLKPKKLMSLERYVIVGSFILGAILTPTPDPVNQALMSVPIIITYQIGVFLVWITNRKRNRAAAFSVQPLIPTMPEEVLYADLYDEPVLPLRKSHSKPGLDFVAQNVQAAAQAPTQPANRPVRARIARTDYVRQPQAIIRDII